MNQFAIYPSLRDRVVLISGGATGIGAELVRQFAGQGSQTAFVDIDGASAQALATSVAAEGHSRPLFHQCDVRDVTAVQQAIAEIARQLGPVDILVNNAANDQRREFETMTTEEWDDAMAVNQRHHFFAIQAVAPMMRASGGGAIVNLGSISWHVRLEGLYGYATAKAGIEGLTRFLARELGRDAIRVNCVVPGWILTERQRELWLTPELETEVMRSQCLAELLRPDDVARLVLWLSANDSRLCTGQNWVVDGGWM